MTDDPNPASTNVRNPLSDAEEYAIRAAVREWAGVPPPEPPRRPLVQLLYPTPHVPGAVLCICGWCQGVGW